MRVRVDVQEFDLKPIGVCAQTLEYAELEAEIILDEDRNNKNYNGCSLFISAKVLNESFKLEQT